MNFLKKTLSRAAGLSRNLKWMRKYSDNLYEPDYLEGMKSKVPLYDTLDVQLRGYDYPVLESYQKYLHNLVKNLEVNVEDCWATPPQDFHISTYKPRSELVNSHYKLKLYDRTVQITDISTIQLPILYRVLEATTPVGVTVHVVPHEEYHEENRYVPDSDLNKLKGELEEMGGPSKKK